MATDALSFETVSQQDDIPPVTDVGPFDPRYPDSTADAPFGFKPDGTPYTRHHGKRGGSSGASKGVKRTAASEPQARAAAGLLARVNALICISITMAGLPGTAASIVAGNDAFEQMAYEALLNDPVLCKKILSAGASSGKAQLIMAYGMLVVSAAPAAMAEIKARREAIGNE